jgi:hypothetical protein
LEATFHGIRPGLPPHTQREAKEVGRRLAAAGRLVTLSVIAVLGGLLLLFVALLPLGAVLIRVAERWVGRRFGLSTAERVVCALYASGAVFFILASLPFAVFGFVLVVGLLVVGAIAIIALWWREGWRAPREATRWLFTSPGILLMAGTLGLLLLEVVATGTQDFPNANDGSWQSLYVLLIVNNHTLPWTIQPYANYGITYPSGAQVWMSLPVILFRWPVTSGAVTLPPLFLSLSLVGAYCWGERLGGISTRRGWQTGLVFAAFFGLIGSWPRLFIGGSYDFVFCLPLLLLTFGWLIPFVRGPLPGWRDVVVWGVLLGVSACLSVAVGELLFFLVVGFVLAFAPNFFLVIGSWTARVTVILLIGVGFLVRSLIGIGIWFSYPGHVLSAVGSPPYASAPVGPNPPIVSFTGDLDPFLLWKPKLSPLPLLSLELALLLALGLVILLLWFATPGSQIRRLLPSTVVAPIVVITGITLLFTAALVVLTPSSLGGSFIGDVTDVDESSFLLFMCYQAIALIPLLVGIEYLRSRTLQMEKRDSRFGTEFVGENPQVIRRENRPCLAPLLVVGLLVLTFCVGSAVTVTEAPSYLQQHLEGLANVTAGDLAALDWGGAHLTSCDRVLAAPLSAAMFLPLYSSAKLIFPAAPLSANLSYSIVVGNFTHGVYSNDTRSALLSLGVTEVFVTGQTSVSFAAFEPKSFNDSPDFSVLFHSGDATIFLFLPGEASSSCPPP